MSQSDTPPGLADERREAGGSGNLIEHRPPQGGLSRQQILSLYLERGGLAYDGEGVTQFQHGWQCARLAREAGAPPALQLAAWLHDLGHLMTGWEGSPTLQGIDDTHETLGAQALVAAFGAAVAEPVALHVEAKRCLVAAQPAYLESLSPDSVRSLALQGGPMSTKERALYMLRPHAKDAMRLRVWDDLAKQPDLWPADPAAAWVELAALMESVGPCSPGQ
jgi:phosphonate degradation associated HDIG domain protein